MAQNTSPAVMAQRIEPHDSLDYFPTPPWAVRALCEHLDTWGSIEGASCWEPACGSGDMVRALELAGEGVALLVRTSFLEGIGRHERLFARFPPEWILQFTERVPMVKGRLDGNASTATAYCWIVWAQPCPSGTSRAPRHLTHFPAFRWLPPCRRRLELPGDYPEA